MSEPITPRGFEPRSLKNSLARRPRPSGPAQVATAPSRPETSGAEPPDRVLPPAPEPSPVEPEARGEGPGSSPATSPSRDAAGDRRRPRAPRGQTVFYLPIDLSERLRATAHQQAKTHAEVIFDAIEARLDDLSALLREAEPAPSGGGVFTRAEPKQAGPKVQVSGQIRSDNLRVIDRLVEEHGADSRSQLVEVALRAHLDGPAASSR
jgi:hypothetical protein